jgi:hypothetical protein
LFLLATTLFNTIRANRVEQNTTTFRKEASRQLALISSQLEEQRGINAELQRQVDELRALQPAGGPES